MKPNWYLLSLAHYFLYKMNSIKSCLVLGIFILATSGTPLYSPSDGIVLLENDTITSTIYNSPVAWFVEFYSSWCGHCQSFAPSWKRLAREVEGWTNVIRVAAIDCAEARNLKSCENFSIQGYPTLKFFKALTVNKDIGTSYEGRRSPRIMRQAMIDFVESEGNSKIQPGFTPLDAKLSDEYYQKKFSPKHLVLVFEKKKSYLGRELTLDLMNNPNVSVKRVIDDDVKRKKKYHVTRLPQVILLTKKQIVTLVNHTRSGIMAEFKNFNVIRKNPPTPKTIEATNERFKEIHKNDLYNFKQANLSVVHMQDLDGALSLMFRREIVIKKIIRGKRLKALEAFVDLLVQCFPGRPPVNKFFKSLKNWLTQKTNKFINPVSLRLFYDMHQADTSAQLPDEIDWQTCQGSIPQYRGYPCSLWLLFHTLTVNCASRQQTRLSGSDVLVRIRDYVKNFFSCIECANHFGNMSMNVENEVHSHDESILWLWEAHNRVNKRLSKEPSTDPKFPKIQYPSNNLCLDCNDNKKYINDKPKWKKDVVLQFIKVHYGVNNIFLANDKSEEDIQTDEKDLSESVRFTRGSHNVIGLNLNHFDTSLCLVVYGTGVLVLIMLYIYMLRRRTRIGKYQGHMA